MSSEPVAEKLPAGKHQRVWEANGLASGVYLYRMEAGEFVQTRKLALLNVNRKKILLYSSFKL
jgi:hypothetical protein